jgi:hypothetical protein
MASLLRRLFCGNRVAPAPASAPSNGLLLWARLAAKMRLRAALQRELTLRAQLARERVFLHHLRMNLGIMALNTRSRPFGGYDNASCVANVAVSVALGLMPDINCAIQPVPAEFWDECRDYEYGL